MRNVQRSKGPQLRAAYDLVAPEYASRFASELSGKPFDRKMLDWFAERVGGSGSILDLGCGPSDRCILALSEGRTYAESTSPTRWCDRRGYGIQKSRSIKETC
jgi:hypothetical protein